MDELFTRFDELKSESTKLPKKTRICKVRCRKILLEISKSCKSCRQALLEDMKNMPKRTKKVIVEPEPEPEPEPVQKAPEPEPKPVPVPVPVVRKNAKKGR